MPSPPGFRSIRWRLAGGIAAILVVAAAITFFAIYRGTGDQLRAQIDHELRTDVAGFTGSVPPRPSVPREIEAAAARYVAAQPFQASARLLVARVAGGRVVTNEPEVLALRRERDEPESRQAAEKRQARALLTSPVGYSTIDVTDVGDVRLLSRPVYRAGRRVAVVGVGEPLQPVERAQHEVARTFAVAGSLTLAAALIASFLLAARISGPLRKMSATAAQVDAGDLSPRMRATGPRDEVRILADAFDHMLDRLEDAFARQRGFVSDASHELRTPLTVIRGQLEVLGREKHPSPDDVRRVEQLVRTELVRMQRLVDDLLVLAKADERDFLHPREIPIPEFVDELVDGMRATADRRFYVGDLPRGSLAADADRIAQALRNLLVNAIAHTRDGGTVSLTATARNGRLNFDVEDDGPGIEPDQRGRIFDRFHRTDAARTRSAGGTGLGLAIVKAVVDAHGGTVDVGDSRLGGARVSFDVPGFSRGTEAAS
jgi:two-component system, OmpR family, sensor kinase